MKKIILALIILLLPTLAFGANTTHTVNTGGGADYTSLSAWEDAIDGTAYDPGDTATVNCSGSTADTTKVTIAGWDPDVTIIINGDNTTGKYSTSHYRIVVNSGSGIFNIQHAKVWVNNLQVKNTYGGGDAAGNCQTITTANSMAGDIRIDKFIGDSHGEPARFGYNTHTRITNSIFIGDLGTPFFTEGDSGGDFYLYNSVVITYADAAVINTPTYGIKITNSYLANGGATATIAAGDTITTSATDDGAQSTITAAYSTSSGAYFTNVTATTEDFHITTTDGALDGVGTDLSGTFTDDIDGDTRTTWDIGVDYIASASSRRRPPIVSVY